MKSAGHLSEGALAMDGDLDRVEAELTEAEGTLASELTRLAATGTELDRKLRVLRTTAAEAALAGVRDGALDARLQVAAVPAVDAHGAFERSLAARRAAVAARQEVVQAVGAQTVSVKQRLAALAQQLHGDEKAAQRLATLARQKAKAAEEEARAAEAEARAAAQRKTLPPPPAAVEPVPALPPLPPPPPAAARAVASPVVADPKRASPRVRMQASVDLSSDDNFFNGFSSNISDGGLFVATVNMVPIGTEVELTFTLPTGEKIEAHGVVRWAREVNDKVPDAFPGIGVQFSRLESAAHQAIVRFVESREPMFFA
jgi:uncharacterized protein (TIGR02266 family)